MKRVERHFLGLNTGGFRVFLKRTFVKHEISSMRMIPVLFVSVLAFVLLVLLFSIGMPPGSGWVGSHVTMSKGFAHHHRPSEQFRELISRGWPSVDSLERIEGQELVVDNARRRLIEQMKIAEIANLWHLQDADPRIKELKRHYDEENLVLTDMLGLAASFPSTKKEAETIQIRRRRVARGEAFGVAREQVLDRFLTIRGSSVDFTRVDIERLESLADPMGDESWTGVQGFLLSLSVNYGNPTGGHFEAVVDDLGNLVKIAETSGSIPGVVMRDLDPPLIFPVMSDP